MDIDLLFLTTNNTFVAMARHSAVIVLKIQSLDAVFGEDSLSLKMAFEAFEGTATPWL